MADMMETDLLFAFEILNWWNLKVVKELPISKNIVLISMWLNQARQLN